MVKSITAIGITLSALPQFSGIEKDLITLMRRTNADWHSHHKGF
jgi:hypothetical protein